MNSDMKVQMQDALFALDRKLVSLFWEEKDPGRRHRIRDCIGDVIRLGQYMNHLEEQK